MIDKSFLRELDPERRILAVEGIKMLGLSGVIPLQIAAGFESVAAGAVDEDPATLTARILNYRSQNHGLLALQALSDELRKDS